MAHADALSVSIASSKSPQDVHDDATASSKDMRPTIMALFTVVVIELHVTVVEFFPTLPPALPKTSTGSPVAMHPRNA